MALASWMVRAGRNGERVDQALAEGLAIVGWAELPDLSTFSTRHELRAALHAAYPNRSNYLIGNWTGQLWRFSHTIRVGDLIVLPLKAQSRYAIGEVRGPYEFRAHAAAGSSHVIPVSWLRTDVERDEFAADLRNTLGSLLTVYGITRHNAPARIQAIANGRADPGWRHEDATAEVDGDKEELWAKVASGERVFLTVRELLALWGYNRRTSVSEEAWTSRGSSPGHHSPVAASTPLSNWSPCRQTRRRRRTRARPLTKPTRGRTT